MLNNSAYISEAVHKGESYPGEHEPIIDQEMWEKGREKIAPSHMTQVLRLTRLAQEIVEAGLDERQGSEVTLACWSRSR